MKWLSYSTLFFLGVFLFSCVEDETVFVDKADVLAFDRQLFSIAQDENPIVAITIENFEKESVIEDYDVVFSSSNTNVFTVNDEGVLTAVDGALGDYSGISVTATLKQSIIDLGEQEATFLSVVKDSILVGRVTLSANEALGFNSDAERKNVALNGFEPRGVINNEVSSIAVTDEDIVLNATFFNFKNEDLSDLDLTWNTSNSAILDIDELGRLMPLTRGVAEITVSAIIDGEIVTSPALSITVAEETIIEEPESEVGPSIIGSGRLESNSFYDVSGSFRIVTEGAVTSIVISDDFRTGNVPDLVLYLSNVTNTNSGALEISEDIFSEGGQSFIIPEGVNVSEFRNVLLFCRNFNQRVGFGVINR